MAESSSSALFRASLYVCEAGAWSKRTFAIDISQKLLLELASQTEISRKFTLGNGSKTVICDTDNRKREAEALGAPHEFVFKVEVPEQKLLFCASSAKRMLKWVKAFHMVTSGVFQTDTLVEQGPISGFLYKTNPSASKWERRYFYLEPSDMKLTYAKNEKKAISGTLNLDNHWLLSHPSEHRVASFKKSPPKPHVFLLIGPDRTFNLCAESEEEKEHWVSALAATVQQLDVVHAADYSDDGAVIPCLEGDMHKTDRKQKKWDHRWFVLDPLHLTLAYFENRRSPRTSPKGTIELTSGDVEVIHPPQFPAALALPTEYSFQLRVGTRTFGLAAPNLQELRAWHAVLHRVVHPESEMVAIEDPITASEDTVAESKAEADTAAEEPQQAEETAGSQAEAENTARLKAEAEEAAKRKAEAEEAARLKAKAEAAARSQAEAEEAARVTAEAEAAAKLQADMARAQAEAEEAARLQAMAEEAAALKARAEEAERAQKAAQAAANAAAADEAERSRLQAEAEAAARAQAEAAEAVRQQAEARAAAAAQAEAEAAARAAKEEAEARHRQEEVARLQAAAEQARAQAAAAESARAEANAVSAARAEAARASIERRFSTTAVSIAKPGDIDDTCGSESVSVGEGSSSEGGESSDSDDGVPFTALGSADYDTAAAASGSLQAAATIEDLVVKLPPAPVASKSAAAAAAAKKQTEEEPTPQCQCCTIM